MEWYLPTGGLGLLWSPRAAASGIPRAPEKRGPVAPRPGRDGDTGYWGPVSRGGTGRTGACVAGSPSSAGSRLHSPRSSTGSWAAWLSATASRACPPGSWTMPMGPLHAHTAPSSSGSAAGSDREVAVPTRTSAPRAVEGAAAESDGFAAPCPRVLPSNVPRPPAWCPVSDHELSRVRPGQISWGSQWSSGRRGPSEPPQAAH